MISDVINSTNVDTATAATAATARAAAAAAEAAARFPEDDHPTTAAAVEGP